MFCAPGLGFGGTEGVGSRFHVLLARTLFLRYRGRRMPFSYFACPDSFSAVPRASCPIFMFCAPGLVFGGTEVFVSRFHVLRARTRFRRYRGCRHKFSCFLRPDPIRRYRGRRHPFSCFARSDTVSSASTPVFMFCTPGLVFDGPEGVGSRFHVLRARTRFRRYGGRRLPFSCFACPDSFSTVLRSSAPIFMFCEPGLIFGGTEGVVSRFHVLHGRTRFRWYRGRRVLVFMFCAPKLIFSDTEDVV
jgi:hypothetical protein